MNKVVAFDLDGTLSQSESFLLKSYRDALANKGLPAVADERLREMIGGTLDDNIQIAMPGHSMEEFLEYAAEIHRLAAIYVQTLGKVYPGIPQSLETLRSLGYRIALCSNGTEDYVGHILESLQIIQYFDFMQHSVAGCTKSQLLGRIIEHFDTRKVVMVGDRHFDETAARNNAVPFIGCGYGLFPHEVQNADIVLKDAAQLPQAVLQLIG